MNDWRDLKLGDVLTLQRGFDITRANQLSGTVPVVSSSGIGSYHSEAKVQGPGVVIGRKGSLGTCFFLNQAFWPHDTTLWVKDFKGNDPHFCYFLLKSMDLAKFDVGAANPTLNRNHVHILRVRCPSISTQRRIAGVLGAYDELIEVNRRRIALLEAMARRLFEEWFVHFRLPGREDRAMAGKKNGSLPSGWRSEELGAVCSEIRDTVLPSDVESNTPYVGLEHIPRRSTTLDAWGRADEVTSTKLRFRAGDVLFGKIRPYFHKVVFAPFEGVSSSDAIVIRSRSPDFIGLVLSIASSDSFVAHSVATSNGTKMPRANWGVLARTPIAVPPVGLLATFNKAVVSWAELAASLNGANARLAASRDLILPRVISGKLSVSAAASELEAVA